MYTCVGERCTTARIDHKLTRTDGSTIAVNFQNNVPGGKSPDQPVKTATAKTFEDGLKASKASSVTVNSTTGGHQSGDHAKGNAVDVSQINGHNVGSAAAGKDVQNLQEAFRGQDKIRENFGPALVEKTYQEGGVAKPLDPVVFKDVYSGHETHVHESTFD